MTEPDCFIPLRIGKSRMMMMQSDSTTGFPTFKILMACFLFLGESVSKLSYEAYKGTGKARKPHILLPLNEFFLMLCRL